MEITWLGHACFLIKGREVTVLTDPHDPSAGYTRVKPPGDIVTISVEDPLHNFLDTTTDYKRVIRGPGEYQLANISITGVRFPRHARQTEPYNRNTAYRIELEDISICHLGQIQQVPSAEQLMEVASRVDILFVPVEGGKSLNARQAIEVINLVEPRVVIPMLYSTVATSESLDSSIQGFAKAVGLTNPEVLPKLTITHATVPSERTIVLLKEGPDYPR